jgi:PAS domain S-box-containing protein
MQSSVTPSRSLEQEVEELRQRVEEAEEALRAIRSGEVDALIIDTEDGECIYTLQNSEHPYRVMVETMNEGAATVLSDGTILYCNECLANMLGMPLEKILGSSIYSYISPLDYDRFSHLLNQAVKGAAREEMTLITNNMPPLPAQLSMRKLPIDGEYPAACLIVTGLAEQRRSREELEAKVVERTAELAQRNRELQDFASVISHDLKEPLRKVQNFGALLIQNSSAHLTTSEIDYIHRMQDAALRMGTMIDGLLALSSITTRSNPHQMVDLNRVARDVVSILETSLERNGGKIEVGELPIIEAEPTQMQQLLQNLIGNALKFHKTGVAPVVRVSSRFVPGPHPNTSRIQILVEDNGIGFEQSDADRLFQPFKRLVGRKEFEGNGLGLAICKKIVDRHFGQISVKSALGLGSTFIVTLPFKQH